MSNPAQIGADMTAQDSSSPAVATASVTPNTAQSSATPTKDATAPKDQTKGKKPTDGGGDQKLSGKELKLKKQAEKQARRAQEKSTTNEASITPTTANGSPLVSKQGKGKAPASDGAKSGPLTAAGQAQQRVQTQHRRTGSMTQAQRPLPLRRRGSQTATSAPAAPRKQTKVVGLFGHLYGQPRRQNFEGVSKEVHPAVLALGFQLSNYVITGSSARCVAMLLAFKAAIASYTTPPTTSLARHLTSHYLSPQIEYLKSHRPISVSMGNAIRWLKDYIIHIDPDVPENVAKADIIDAIDTFIRERITVADTAIAATASAKIRPGAHVVTFAKSSIVEQTLLAAAREGISFSVTVLDSRPLFEGRNLASALSKAGPNIKCRYALLPAATHVLAGANLVLLGAHAMMANGRLYSRAGTASVAMLAKTKDVPVIVCCESIKFTDRVALDSVVLNEVAPSEELVIRSQRMESEPVAIVAAGGGNKSSEGKKGIDAKGAEEKAAAERSGLDGWNEVHNLQLLNIMYDVTPAQYVDMVITEYGSLPPSSVPVVHRLSTERDVRV